MMLRYLTTVKLFGGAAVILTLALSADPASARTFKVFVKNTTETQVFVGATVCLGHSSTATEYGSKNTDNTGSVTFTGVSNALSIYIDVVRQGVGSHQFVWPAGTITLRRLLLCRAMARAPARRLLLGEQLPPLCPPRPGLNPHQESCSRYLRGRRESSWREQTSSGTLSTRSTAIRAA